MSDSDSAQSGVRANEAYDRVFAVGYTSDPIPVVDAEREESLYEPLTDSLRRLIDVTIRSEAADSVVTQARRRIDEAVTLLSSRLRPNSFGVRTSADGRMLAFGNVAVGLRNAIAPPLRVRHEPDGGASTDLTLGAPYEGPPGLVHGGVCALVLDHVLGATAHRPHAPAFTGTLTIRYLHPTPLGQLRAEAWVDRHEGTKTFAAGHITDANGVVTVQAEGIFIRPRGLR
ncbi:PaaI family thioesterase [Mycobacterium sp. 852013-50091_SCH5140682]|uniref:PaaI family thioesterase n=1 Tax=Mycobacterium sp. 852013-50091_SCH5140682 TaxID=1834109 RepID=UPI0009EDD1A4|nr:PaaI family thioesterase [Mycobacterium sp. 852013-50091_SCH5140682]